LDAHHIRKVADGGVADPEELLCVCPNCHRMVQRLGETGLRDLLRQLGIKG
jgi:predicted HNH restriction endonuclease